MTRSSIPIGCHAWPVVFGWESMVYDALYVVGMCMLGAWWAAWIVERMYVHESGFCTYVLEVMASM